MGTPIGNSGLLTTAWFAAIAAGRSLWARGLNNRNSAP
jgi:hypothetical protein